jgi:hypothetical protein
LFTAIDLPFRAHQAAECSPKTLSEGRNYLITQRPANAGRRPETRKCACQPARLVEGQGTAWREALDELDGA